MSSRPGVQVRAVRFGERAPVGRFLAAGGVLIAAAWGLGLAVTGVGASATGELSLDVYLAHHRSLALTQVSLVINVLLGTSVAPIVLVALAALAAKVWHWIAGALVMVVTAAAWVAAAIGKVLVHRSRPPGGVLHAVVSETGVDSYPSGHTAFAAGLLASAVLISYLYGRSAWSTAAFGLPAVMVVGVSRLYLGVHYLGDVIGSSMVAAASTLVLVGTYNACWRWLRSRPRAAAEPEAGAGMKPALPADSHDDSPLGRSDMDSDLMEAEETSSGQVGALMDMLEGSDADSRR